MLQLPSAECGVHRDRHRSEPGAAEPQLEELDTVLAHRRDSVAGADSGGDEAAGRPGYPVAQLRDRQLEAVPAHERPLAMPLGLQLEQRRQRPLRRR